MRSHSILKAILAAMLVVALTPAPAALAQSGVRIGTLTCNVRAGWGHIVTSDRQLDCAFHPSHRRVERYRGTLSRYGLDVGYFRGGAMVWEVVAPASNVGRGALAGDYGGASANATLGLGVGANILIGGFRHSFSLQPLSVEGNTGLGVAAGVGVLHLHYV